MKWHDIINPVAHIKIGAGLIANNGAGLTANNSAASNGAESQYEQYIHQPLPATPPVSASETNYTKPIVGTLLGLAFLGGVGYYLFYKKEKPKPINAKPLSGTASKSAKNSKLNKSKTPKFTI